MKKVNSGNSSLLMSFVEILIGILLLINPVGFTSGIIVALGIVLAIMGLGQIISYFRTDAEEAASGGKLTKGILFAVLGLFCAFHLFAGLFLSSVVFLQVKYYSQAL